MKPIILALLLLLPLPASAQDLESRIKNFRNHKRFSISYDKFRDKSRIEVGPFVVTGTVRYVSTGNMALMTATFTFAGVRISEPPKDFVLLFAANGRGWTFLKARELLIIVDGERFDLGEGEWDGDVEYGGTSEILGFTIPAELFKKLGTAQKAELRVGDIELTLKDEHKEAFRDLLSLSSCTNCPRATL